MDRLPASRTDESGGFPEASRSGRFRALDARPVNLDGFVHETPELGFAAMRSTGDPPASLRIEDGVVVELDGRRREAFDLIDLFIADHAISLDVAAEAMAIEPLPSTSADWATGPLRSPLSGLT